MPKFIIHVLVFILGFCMIGLAAQAADDNSAPDPTKRVLVIYDSSSSMWGELSDKSRKYEAGRSALASFLEGTSATRQIGFRAYGHRRAGDCRDSELMVSFAGADAAKTSINTAVGSIRPTGKTPITYSLREGLKDFDGATGDILLISDGIETCDIDPCELMRQWNASGINIRVHVVGVGLNDMERGAMSCIAETSGGTYFDAGSEGELLEAMNEAAVIPPGDPNPLPQTQGYALILNGVDKEGRSFVMNGKLFKGGEGIKDISSNGRNGLEGPGEYEIEVGVVLQDGSLYKPVRQKVTVEDRGDTKVDVLVTRPAIVSASFSEDGEDHKGSFVTAFQDGKKVFGFRRFDEALARPGAYEFRSTPNKDNELKVEATLTEAEHTVLDFTLVKTVRFLVKYMLPNGETDQRTGQLFKGDNPVYGLHTSNFATALPGTYELRDKFPRAQVLNPLPEGITITITDEDEQIIEVPMSAGFIVAEYAGDDRDFISKRGGYLYIHALDADGKSIGSQTASPGKVRIAKPGRYRILGHSGKGYFDPVEVMVEHDKTVTAKVMAKPTAHISMSYADADYDKTPDRASLVPLDGQKPIKTFMRPGAVLKVPPGRYRIKPQNFTGITPLEFELIAGESKTVVLK